MDHLNAKNLMSYLNLPNSILCVNTHSPCGKTRIIPSTQFPHQLDMTGHLNVTNFMRHLNVTNSLIYLNTHNLRGKIHITSSTSAEVPISSPTWLNGSSCVTNFMRRLNVTNSIFYLPTHRLRGKMRIKSSTAGKVPVSSPTWHEGSSKCHEVYEASKCHELKSHELNYASTYPQATREDAYKVINSCRSANLLPTDSMYASWIQVHTIRVYVCIHIQPCTHVHICICICVQSCTHVHKCVCSYIYHVSISCPSTACVCRGFRYKQYAYIYVYIHNHVRTYTYVYVYVYNHVHTYTCVCSYMYHISISCPPIACMRFGCRYIHERTPIIYAPMCTHSVIYTYINLHVLLSVHIYNHKIM